jgi:hypothetical protein
VSSGNHAIYIIGLSVFGHEDGKDCMGDDQIFGGKEFML